MKDKMLNITESRITFDIAKRLKELGFQAGSNSRFDIPLIDIDDNTPAGTIEEDIGYMMNNSVSDYSNDIYICYENPSIDVVFEWLRTKHNIYIYIKPWNNSLNPKGNPLSSFNIVQFNNAAEAIHDISSGTDNLNLVNDYDKCRLMAINEALDLIST